MSFFTRDTQQRRKAVQQAIQEMPVDDGSKDCGYGYTSSPHTLPPAFAKQGATTHGVVKGGASVGVVHKGTDGKHSFHHFGSQATGPASSHKDAVQKLMLANETANYLTKG